MNNRTADIVEKLIDKTTKKPLQYKYANTTERRHSFIIENDEDVFIPLAEKPSAGFTAYTRFFAATAKDQPKFVVKQPKFNNTLASCVSAYKNELDVWNSVYPDQKAELVTKGGIRLILPCLPGQTISICKSDDPLIYYKQIVAIIYAVQRFHQLGWSHNDFNKDNVLVHEKPNGSFEAYLIDFASVSKRSDFISNSEWVIIGSMLCRIYGLPVRYNDVTSDNINLVIDFLLLEIKRLEKLNADVAPTFAMVKSQVLFPEPERYTF